LRRPLGAFTQTQAFLFAGTNKLYKLPRIATINENSADLATDEGGLQKLQRCSARLSSLGLAYIAATLEREGHEVRIVDLEVEQVDEIRLKGIINRFSPGIIGLSAVTPIAEQAYRIIDSLKPHFKDIPFIIGGPHVTALPEEGLRHADIVVRGEAEQTLSSLLRCFHQRGLSLKE